MEGVIDDEDEDMDEADSSDGNVGDVGVNGASSIAADDYDDDPGDRVCGGTDPFEVFVRVLLGGTEHLDCLKKRCYEMLSKYLTKLGLKKARAVSGLELLEYAAPILGVCLVIFGTPSLQTYGDVDDVRVDLRFDSGSGMWSCNTEGMIYWQLLIL
jgi:hypothetical protein